MHYYKEITYENGMFKFFFVQEPEWNETSIAIDYQVHDVNHESFLLDALDSLLCGVHLSNPIFAKGILYSLISSLTGVYLLKE